MHVALQGLEDEDEGLFWKALNAMSRAIRVHVRDNLKGGH